MEGFDELVSVWGPNPRCERGYGFQINSNEDGSKLIYGSEKNLVLRDYHSPEQCLVYTDHRGEVTAAKFNHKGDTIASADSLGRLHLLKLNGSSGLTLEKETVGLGGKIFDLCWWADDKGLAVAGDCKGVNGRVFTLGGTDRGAIQAAKRLTSIDMCGQLLITGSDDGRARTYYNKGGYKAAEKDIVHDNSCNAVRFSPSGKLLVNAGGKNLCINRADADFGEVRKITAAHKQTIYAVSWSSDSRRFITASADRSVKLWDVETGAAVSTWDMKKKSGYKSDGLDFQVGCCFAGENIVSLSLSGDINYLDDKTANVARIVRGATSGMTAVDVDRSSGNVVGMSAAGEMLLYGADGVDVKRAVGLSDPKKGVGCALVAGKVVGTAWDDRIAECDAEMKLAAGGVNLEHQPIELRRAAVDGGRYTVTTKNEVYIMDGANNKRPTAVFKVPSDVEATCSCLSPEGNELAVGVSKKEVRFYSVSGDKVNATPVRTFGGFTEQPECISYSKALVAIGTKNKYIKVTDRATGGDFCGDYWAKHSSTVQDVQFSPDEKRLLSVGQEGNICIWDATDGETFKPKKEIALAHKGGIVSGKWLDDNTFVTGGKYDGTIKKWTI